MEFDHNAIQKKILTRPGIPEGFAYHSNGALQTLTRTTQPCGKAETANPEFDKDLGNIS